MTIQEKIAQYKAAIKEAEARIDNPHLPLKVYEVTEKAIATLSNKLMLLQSQLKSN